MRKERITAQVAFVFKSGPHAVTLSWTEVRSRSEALRCMRLVDCQASVDTYTPSSAGILPLVGSAVYFGDGLEFSWFRDSLGIQTPIQPSLARLRYRCAKLMKSGIQLLASPRITRPVHLFQWRYAVPSFGISGAIVETYGTCSCNRGYS